MKCRNLLSSSFYFVLPVICVLTFVTGSTQADTVAGKAKFEQICASCHGSTGVGDGVAAATLNPKPRDLQLTTKSDDELKKVIKEGGAANGLSVMMPAWGAALTDEDISNVVEYVRTLKK